MVVDKVLIIQNKQLGDVMLSTVIADNIKRLYPATQVDFFSYINALPLLKHHPNIDKIWAVNEKDLKQLPVLLEYIYKIRKEKYDIIFDPYNKLQSKFISLFSSAKQTISYSKDGKSFFYSHPVRPAIKSKLAGVLALEDKLRLLEKAFPDHQSFSEKYQVHLTPTQKQHGFQLLKSMGVDLDQKPLIIIGIQGSDDWKSYPPEYMAELVSTIKKEVNAYILFNYMPHQKHIAQKIYESLSDKQDVFPELIGENMEDFLCALSHCKAVVACEGGLIHMAKALDIPNMNIYSPFISRESWGTLESDQKNASVHLIDYRPDLFIKKTKAEIENNSFWYYKHFLPEYIAAPIVSFLKSYL